MRLLICIVLLLSTCIVECQEINIIPRPVEVTKKEGSYLLKDRMTVGNDFPANDWAKLFPYFKTEMKKLFDITITEVTKGKDADIEFNNRRMPTSGKPAYQLTVSKSGITIASNFDEPAFNAIQTLFQLMPVDAEVKREIPLVAIFDYARFNYRGMHLDVSRHFFPVDFVKRYIDYLAYHKLNTFHWHLTDDQGWRIEIKKYPKLTSVGAWRNGTIIGRYPGNGNDGKKHGGFYTQEQIKEVVKYAKERFITVIPEIEMPGHASAAIAAYPELSCFPDEPTIKYFPKQCKWYGDTTGKQVQQTWGVFDDVFTPSEYTFNFLQNVLDEVIPLFPSTYIHIGGDECPKENWKRSAFCQQLIKDKGLKDEHGLQSYFIQRIEKYLNSKGKKIIGWDEILEGGLAPNATVMSWRGEQGGIDAAKQKHDVIMTPGNPVYFDHSQSENEDSVTIGGYNPIEKVYAYEPVPKELDEEQAKYILGAQANVWTEYMDNPKKVEYMIFPRMAALSEILWSSKENRNWDDFAKRLPVQIKRYEKWGANYSKAYFDLKATVWPTADYDGVIWKLENKNNADDIIIFKSVKKGSSDDGLISNKKECARTIKSDGIYFGYLQAKTVVKSQVAQQFHFNKATGKKITLTNPPSKNYPGDGAFTLVNGIINEKGYARTKEFLGFKDNDCEAVIDLGESQLVSFVVVNTLNRTTSWIWRPQSAEVFGSGDGQTWYPLKQTDDFEEKDKLTGKGTMTMAFKATYAQYLKVVVRNWGIIPEGNAGAGNKAWLFVDEIEVEGPSEKDLK